MLSRCSSWWRSRRSSSSPYRRCTARWRIPAVVSQRLSGWHDGCGRRDDFTLRIRRLDIRRVRRRRNAADDESSRRGSSAISCGYTGRVHVLDRTLWNPAGQRRVVEFRLLQRSEPAGRHNVVMHVDPVRRVFRPCTRRGECDGAGNEGTAAQAQGARTGCLHILLSPLPRHSGPTTAVRPVRPDQRPRLQFFRQYDNLGRRVLELLEIIPFYVLELRPDDARRGPFAVLAERDIADDRLERVAAEIVSQLAVIDASALPRSPVRGAASVHTPRAAANTPADPRPRPPPSP